MKPRKIVSQLEKAIKRPDKKILFLWGPRQIGKSTILNYLHQKYGGSYFNFDNLDDQRLFVPELKNLESAIKLKMRRGSRPYIFIDEIQKYPDATQSVKLLVDIGRNVIIATGSSELRAKTNRFDTLAGRYMEFILFPLTIDELAKFHNEPVGFTNNPTYAEKQLLNHYLEMMLIYGSYPGVALSNNKIDELKNIAQNSIIKDIVNIYDLKNTDLIYNLLRLLAMQVGNLINVSELSSSLGSTKATIDNYLSILTKNRIIYLLAPFRTNKRRAYLERKKFFFMDIGIRNALIEDFRPTALRPDLGALFENLVVLGLLRQTYYQRNNNRLFYFREISGRQKEIDLIIETPGGKKTGLEIKYSSGQINKFPSLGIDKYILVEKENAAKFLV